MYPELLENFISTVLYRHQENKENLLQQFVLVLLCKKSQSVSRLKTEDSKSFVTTRPWPCSFNLLN